MDNEALSGLKPVVSRRINVTQASLLLRSFYSSKCFASSGSISRNRKNGFLLIECCVYMVICAILMMTLMRWITQTVLEAGRTVQSTDRALTGVLVHDVIVRDLQPAPSDRSAWLAIAKDHIIWQGSDGKAIGWHHTNKQLVRKEGSYNTQTQQWGKHHASVVASGVDAFSCQIQADEKRVQGITSTLSLEGSAQSSRYVRIRNGRIL